ncbi:helix-turn-helix transcriptional regulator, partial [Anaerosolibacter sp.]|uniref:helix-turn-helix transcriptional regulator n=1 Tax=Anaerosolibacter sp. TaxID=1872527 RepID=UPI0039F03D93
TQSLVCDTIVLITTEKIVGDKLGKNLKLKSARAAKDMSQKDIADAVGVTRQTINAIESGDYNPTINLCIAICKVLDKTLNDIFWEDDRNE